MDDFTHICTLWCWEGELGNLLWSNLERPWDWEWITVLYSKEDVRNDCIWAVTHFFFYGSLHGKKSEPCVLHASFLCEARGKIKTFLPTRNTIVRKGNYSRLVRGTGCINNTEACRDESNFQSVYSCNWWLFFLTDKSYVLCFQFQIYDRFKFGSCVNRSYR